jgi:phenylalanyl-tRNA synthetase alpha chain
MLSIDSQSIFVELKEEISKCVNPTQVIELRNIFVKKHVQPLSEQLKTASVEDKKEIGATINTLKNEIFALTEKRIKLLKEEIENREHVVNSDITINSTNLAKGSLNPITLVVNEIAEFFKKMDFEIVTGNEITTVKYNFDNLNAPKVHPTRETSETFYIDNVKELVENARILRTQNTAVTAEMLENNKSDDIRIATYGYVYRNDDDDQTHSHQFNQFEFV